MSSIVLVLYNMSYVIANITVDIIVTALQMRKWWIRKFISSVFSHSAGEWQKQDLKKPRAAMQSPAPSL